MQRIVVCFDYLVYLFSFAHCFWLFGFDVDVRDARKLISVYFHQSLP